MSFLSILIKVQLGISPPVSIKKKNDRCEAIEETEDLDKFGLGFTSADPLEEIDIGDGVTPTPTFVKKDLNIDDKASLIELLKEYVDCFA
jgi:hypothetical protein